MSKMDGYFTEASMLFGDSDVFVAKMSYMAYRNMLQAHRDGMELPAPGFCILYYIQSTLKWLMRSRSYVVRESSKFPIECPAIRIVNVPITCPSES